MNSYYIWTIGCQMNVADSERLAGALEQVGLQPVDGPGEADVVVLNSCVVRQSAEDKVVGTLGMVKRLKELNPDRVLALMGCMVGPRTDDLKARFPYVDTFMRPQEYGPLLDLLGERLDLDWQGCVGNLAPPRPSVCCYVPVIHGCDLMCAFCIIPYRRGRQVSRPVADIVREVEHLVARGVKEVTLLGQTVDAYGHDLPDRPDLAGLLHALNAVDGLFRIRFLTSHPIFMGQRILEAVAELDKVCEHINLPVQAGDDHVLSRMGRRYTRREYRDLIARIRSAIPHVSLSTDVIVGFPGETRDQYLRTVELIEDVRFDKVHVAAYSNRPGTLASCRMPDDVPQEEKAYRVKHVDAVQERILTEKNSRLLGETVQVLVDGVKRGRWQGRTRNDKLVFSEDVAGHLGELIDVRVTGTSPWSLQGVAAGA
jgi:tRNA-2-methylthio-N6-dimethylallyladenosine synthase